KKAVETKAEEAKPAMTKALAETQKKPEMAKKMDATKIVCQSGKDTRDLSVMKTESGGCELHYSKFGQSNVVATARNGSEHCEEILNRIKGKLEEAKFSCQ
ncbi:MAG: hypothetical protein KDD35_05005, partial [Bdellovibrionales bacterium]|nr:hypothetical protein [Bdellovibrionales bacterium]